MPNTQITKRVARQVRARMILSQVGQAEMAEALGLSQSAVSRRLTGEVPFDVTEIVAAAKLLSVPSSVLVDETPEVAVA